MNKIKINSNSSFLKRIMTPEAKIIALVFVILSDIFLLYKYNHDMMDTLVQESHIGSEVFVDFQSKHNPELVKDNTDKSLVEWMNKCVMEKVQTEDDGHRFTTLSQIRDYANSLKRLSIDQRRQTYINALNGATKHCNEQIEGLAVVLSGTTNIHDRLKTLNY